MLLVDFDGLLARAWSAVGNLLRGVRTGGDVVKVPPRDAVAELFVLGRVADEFVPQVVHLREHAEALPGVRDAERQVPLQLAFVRFHDVVGQLMPFGIGPLHVREIKGQNCGQDLQK